MPWLTKTSSGKWEPLDRYRPVTNDHPRARQLFAPDSFWFRRLPDDAPLEPDSAATIAKISGLCDGININRYQYTPAVYLARNTDPLVSITRDPAYSANSGLTAQLAGIHIPADAVPADGTDAEVVIHNLDTGDCTELWQAKRVNAGAWTCVWGGTIRNARTSDSTHAPGFGTMACGLAFLPSMITPDELRDGWIGHAVGIAMPPSCVDNQVVPPATRTDGDLAPANLVSLAQWLRIPRSVNVYSLGLNRTATILARAAQEYGFLVIDRGGETRAVVRAVNPSGMSSDPYPAILAGHEADPLGDFPIELLQAVTRGWMPS